MYVEKPAVIHISGPDLGLVFGYPDCVNKMHRNFFKMACMQFWSGHIAFSLEFLLLIKNAMKLIKGGCSLVRDKATPNRYFAFFHKSK